jgi:hypothetical protein
VDRAELARLAHRFPARAVGILGATVAAIGGIILVLGLTSEDPARTWWAIPARG